jgi:hypothetical protein
MSKKLVALDLLNTILSKVYTKITDETNEKIETKIEEIAEEKGYADDTFIPLTQKAAANGVATLDANGHVPVEQIVDTTDETVNEFDYLSINDTEIELKSRVHNDYTNSNPNNLIDSSTLYNYNGQWITSEPATTVNPITKLGTVDEGTWVAGDVTTQNLKVNDSTVLNTTTTINDDLHITEKVLDFGGTNYDVWDYVNDNMNWVEE